MFVPSFWPGVRRAADQPDLEVLHRRPTERRFQTPLVFVHGAFVGGWCWDCYFLDWFADQGFEVYAPSLRGHAGSDGHLNSSGVMDYVADLASVIAQLAVPPVIIGHSMGGLVTQRYLEDHSAAAAVLMASVPLTGLTDSSLRLATGDPALFTQMALMQVVPQAVDVAVARRAIFSDQIPDEELARYAGRVQSESQRAIWDMTVGALPRPWRVTEVPMFVLGAADDRLFSPAEVRRTAEAYNAPVHIEPGMAHAMMLEPGWAGIANRIHEWLLGLDLA
jgi:non-heme chloroperoxidase